MLSSKKKIDPWVRSFTVTDPQKHPKGFTVYKVTSRIYPLEAPESVTEVVVWRRYNDFKKLHHQLFTLHKGLHRRTEFPLFAKPKVFGRFDDSVIEERRESASDLLAFVATQSHLFKCDDFVKFFEGGKKVERNEIKAMGSGVLKPVDVNPLHLDLVTEAGDSKEESKVGSVEGDVFTDSLGGVWKYRKPGDNISLNGEDDEYTDDSALSTPLPDTDISFFDPLNDAPESSEVNSESADSLQCSNTWLLSAMREIESPEVRRKTDDNAMSPELDLPSPPMESPEKDCDNVDPSLSGELSVDRDSCIDKNSNLDEFDPLRNDGLQPVPKSSTKDDLLKPQSNSPQSSPKKKFSSVLNNIASRERSQTAESVTGMDLGGSDDYIFQAANQISLAKECEANGNYEVAFGYYKSGVGVLLKGVQSDDNKSRRDAVRRKTAQYLLKAEDIYNRHIASKSEDSKRWGTDSKLSPSSELDPGISYMQGPVSELRNYKVLGVIDRVMLVLDKMTEDTFIIKVLHKAASDRQCHDQNIIPASCPYMVRFFRFYETDFAIYVLLKHASGGKLWNYLHSYLSQLEINKDRSDSRGRTGSKLSTDSQTNVYSGQHLMEGEMDFPSKDTSVLKDAETEQVSSNENMTPVLVIGQDKKNTVSPEVTSEFSRSYVELFTDYETNVSDMSDFGTAHYHKPTANNEDKLCNLMDISDRDVNSVSKPDNENSFHTVLSKTAHPSVELFSINSFDSDSDRKDSAISDSDVSNILNRIPSIPEELDDSAFGDASDIDKIVQYKDDSVTDHGDSDTHPPDVTSTSDAADLISSAKELLKSVDEALAECDDDSTSMTTRNANREKNDIKSQGNDSFPDVSIYDINRSYNSNNSSHDPTTIQDQLKVSSNVENETVDSQNESNVTFNLDEKVESSDGSTITSTPKPLCRQLSQTISLDRSFDSMTTCKNKLRHFSTVFSDLDVMASKASSFKLPDTCIRQWTAEIIIAVGHLHSLDIVCCDLRPDNILLGERGHILLTFFSQWRCVPRSLNAQAVELLYVAPELKQPCRPVPSCDWWSVGVLLYELLTCQTLISAHPAGITSHTQLFIPDHVSEEARSLLSQLLVVNPQERLGSSWNGVEDIKSHPFFSDIDWKQLL